MWHNFPVIFLRVLFCPFLQCWKKKSFSPKNWSFSPSYSFQVQPPVATVVWRESWREGVLVFIKSLLGGDGGRWWYWPTSEVPSWACRGTGTPPLCDRWPELISPEQSRLSLPEHLSPVKTFLHFNSSNKKFYKPHFFFKLWYSTDMKLLCQTTIKVSQSFFPISGMILVEPSSMGLSHNHILSSPVAGSCSRGDGC